MVGGSKIGEEVVESKTIGQGLQRTVIPRTAACPRMNSYLISLGRWSYWKGFICLGDRDDSSSLSLRMLMTQTMTSAVIELLSLPPVHSTGHLGSWHRHGHPGPLVSRQPVWEQQLLLTAECLLEIQRV